MIAFATTIALQLGVPQRFARLAATAALLLLAGLLVWAGWSAVKRNIIARHEERVSAAAERAGRKADNRAADQRTADQARRADEATQLDKVTADAPPAPLSDARRAYHRCVRAQQQAAADGQRPPACR